MSGETVKFLSVDETIAIHETLTAKFGGHAGVRDTGLLESSLFRPQTGCYDDLAAMAAALLESLLFNPAFFDSNRRTAFFATDTFLRINGWRFDVDDAAAIRFVTELAERGDEQRAALLPLVRRSIARV